MIISFLPNIVTVLLRFLQGLKTSKVAGTSLITGAQSKQSLQVDKVGSVAGQDPRSRQVDRTSQSILDSLKLAHLGGICIQENCICNSLV